MSLNKIRNVSAFFFEIVSIAIIVFYSNPQLLSKHQLTKSHQSFFQTGSDNPIVYYKTSKNGSYTNLIAKIQLVAHDEWDLTFDLPSLELKTNKALFVVASLHNVFYVFVSINAP